MILSMVVLAAVATTPAGPTGSAPQVPDYLPDANASKIVAVGRDESAAEVGITVLTQAVAVKETGPAETIAKFGEVYAFSPAFIAVHRDRPTAISFWNLQPDDEHDFMLVDPDLDVMMRVTLPPQTKTSYVFTFHREGLFRFYCTMHQPEMSGQILVLGEGEGAGEKRETTP
jgi:plastocyanin